MAQPMNALRPDLLIGSDWIAEASGGWMDHVNPASGAVQQRVPVAGPDEIDGAVAAARGALRNWQNSTERGEILRRIAAGLRATASELSTIVTLENGIPVMMTAHAAAGAAIYFEYYAGWVDKILGNVYPSIPGLNYTRVEAFGVVACLHSWNASLSGIGHKVASALAAGCTVIIKSPELAPFSAVRFAQICLDAGVPPGVVNLVTGGPETGALLVRHGGVDKISFTGGPETAKHIQAACAATLTPLVLELGGKSATLIFDDADLDKAVGHVVTGFTVQSGQACVAGTRLLVQESVYAEVQERLIAATKAIKVGDPHAAETFMGPLITTRAAERVLDTIAAATSTGAGKLVTGGQKLNGELSNGNFVSPAVLVDVDPDSHLSRNEIFGPVLAVTPFGDEEEAVRLANDSQFGLAAYVHTNNLARAHQMAAELDAGNIAINGGIGNSVNSPYAPFGGFKDSGYGKEGGLEGVMEFQRIKNVNVSF